jgi:hypothetical protein
MACQLKLVGWLIAPSIDHHWHFVWPFFDEQYLLLVFFKKKVDVEQLKFGLRTLKYELSICLELTQWYSGFDYD